ncbi:MAG: sodium:alanine symporter family protein [Acidobacteriota bacterium]|nr:sodium:alanine symporter family protein [Acidobacteriota bacterium]
MDELTERIQAIDGLVWQPFAMPLVLLIVGGLITLSTGLVQIRRFPLALRTVVKSMRGTSSGEGTITQFQALSTALASTVGNGNIGGVATAILIGGPGAIFWMWICAAIGMATKYAEAILGVEHRVTRETGELASGPMYYITRGIPHTPTAKTLASMFAFFGACGALFGTGNMAQSNTVARTFVEAARTVGGLDVPMWIPGLLITVAVGSVLLGGIRRIAAVAERIVPPMIILYVLTAVAYLFINIGQVPDVFVLILSEAFSPTAAVGGFAWASTAQAIAAGVSRGVLSNEAGLGTAPIAHGIAKVSHPVDQGLVGIFEVFTDTIVVCSLTAFVILTSGLWTDPAFQNASGDLTAAALSTTIPGASLIVAVCSFLFGFSTLLGWCYYGEKCVEFLLGSGIIKIYRLTFTLLIMVGSVVSVPLVWALGTMLNGFMAFPNLIGMLFLLGTIKRLTSQYFDRVPTTP